MSITRPRILLMEDREDWIHLVTMLLKQDYDVLAAKSIAEAERLLGTSVFHLAIIDISMVPGDPTDEQGLQLVRDLRSTEILRDMSIIILSAYATVEEAETPERVRVAFRDYKVKDFFDKGRFDQEEFRQSVAEAIADSYLGSLPLSD